MANKVGTELSTVLRNQLKPYGYTGHLLSYFTPKAQLLEDMIKRTALMSESNSVLIIGPRGSGKTAILEFVVEKALKNKAIKENLLYVALDGLVHTNDNLALEDITRQLKMQNDVDDKSLGSFSEKLRLLLAALKSGNKESKSILFVLDNFDLFCSHKNQTLLYNLFDVAQSQQSPICVVGMSCRPDVLQVLENRVNSRFSHQKILLFEEMTFTEYIDSAKHFLTLQKFNDSKFMKKWNADINDIFLQDHVRNTLKNCFYKSNSLRNLKEFLYAVIMRISENHSTLTIDDFLQASSLISEDSKCTMIQGLSVLELSLVIAMMHLTEIYDGEPFNFEIVFNELSKFFRKRTSLNVDKPVVMKAFERLIDLELVRPCSEITANVLKRFMLVRLLADTNEIKEAIYAYHNLPLPLKQWSESSLDC